MNAILRLGPALNRIAVRLGGWGGLIAFFSLALIALVWAIALERTSYEYREAVTGATTQSANLARVVEERTAKTLKSVEQALAQVAREYGERGSEFSIENLIEEDTIDAGLFKGMGVLDEHGRLVSTRTASSVTDMSDRDYFVALKQTPNLNTFVGKPVFGRLTGKWVVPVGRRMNKPDGSFGGVVFGGIDPVYFINIYQEADLGRRGVVSLIGLDGIIRARRTGKNDSFGQDISGSSLLMAQRRAPVGAFTTKGKLDGVRRFQSYRTLADYALVVSVGTSVDEVLAAFQKRERDYRNAAAFATLFILLFAGGLITALWRSRLVREEVIFKNTVLATQQETSLDAILLVDQNSKIVSCNQRFIDMWRIPLTLLTGYDTTLLQASIEQLQDPEEFLARINYLYKHREEKTSDEIRMKDGRTIDRYSAPVIGSKGEYYGRVWYFRDITEQKRSEAAARIEALQRQAILDNIPDVAWLKDTDSHFLAGNAALAKACGQSAEALIGKNDFDFFPANIAECYRADDIEIMRTGKHKDIEESFMLADGTQRVIETIKTRVCDATGTVIGTVGIARDITGRRHAEEQSLLSAKAFESIAEGIMVTDAAMNIVSVNKAFSDISGYQPEEVLGKNPKVFHSDRQDAAFYVEMRQTIKRSGYWRGEIWDRRKSGEIYPQSLSISAVKNPSGAVTHYVGVCTDISSLKRYEELLHHQANHDALTGLPNRVLFQNRFDETLQRAQRHGSKAAVMMLDLDHFKRVNDSLGHAAGDLLLQTISTRLASVIRKGDTVGRFGGDEFAVLLDCIDDNQGAAVVAQKLLEALTQPFTLAGHEICISVSIGISCYPQDATDTATLFTNADVAMYRAKDEGRNSYRFFSAEMNAQALENLLISNSLRLALERNEFRLHYQPRYDLASGQISGVEALIRWQHPEFGLVMPGRFIPVAEETGLIQPIGEWVLKEACRQMRAWRDAGLPLVRIAVNLSARQFNHADLQKRIVAILDEARLPAHYLELEVTESMVMQNPDSAAEVLAQLKAMGVSIAIDDFGTGYSSLSCLKRFPIDFLKIDQSFVKGIPADADDAAITTAIIGLAKSLNFAVIAEGVETEAQYAFLESHGCDQAQGYLFSQPVPPGDIEQMFRLRRPAPPFSIRAAA